MAYGGEESTPLLDDYKKPDDDDDNADQTSPFVPNGSSTPAPEFQTAQKEKYSLPEIPELPELPQNFMTELPSLSTTIPVAEGELEKEFPDADKNKLKMRMDRKGRLEVGLISPKKPYYRLLTEIPGRSGKYQVSPQLPKEVLRALGESRRETIIHEVDTLNDVIKANKKMADDPTQSQEERNKARERAKMQISTRADLYRQYQRLVNGEYTRDGGGQSIPLETLKKNEEERKKKKNNYSKKNKNKRRSLLMKTYLLQKKKKPKKKSKKLIKN